MPELIIRRAGERLTRQVLGTDAVVVGRDPGCSVVLLSDFVSRRHARLVRRGDTYEISDNGSRNGVFLNGARLDRPYLLKKGDEIAIADFVLTYWVASDDASTVALDEVMSDILRVDTDAKAVWVGSRRLAIRLSPQEFDLLALLFENRGKALSREAIGDRIWGQVLVGGKELKKYEGNMVHRLVFRLKGKLEREIDVDRHIVNIPGLGYRLDEHPVTNSNDL